MGEYGFGWKGLLVNEADCGKIAIVICHSFRVLTKALIFLD